MILKYEKENERNKNGRLIFFWNIKCEKIRIFVNLNVVLY